MSGYPIYCRTCYQSESFNNLQQIKRKPMMDTMEKMSTAGFTIVGRYPEECYFLNQIIEERGLKK
jgi:hypothetical protein